MNIIDFKCNDCGCTDYKLVYWELKKDRTSVGVYCVKCDKWLKFLGAKDEMTKPPIKVLNKSQRPRKKNRCRKK